MSAPDATEPVGCGTMLCGRYRLVRLVAQGGMASVWEGHDNVLARSVAVKMLHPHLAQDRLFLEAGRPGQQEMPGRIGRGEVPSGSYRTEARSPIPWAPTWGAADFADLAADPGPAVC